MRVYIGVDFHARVQPVSYLTSEEGEIRQVELSHRSDRDLYEVRAFYGQFAGEVIVGMETNSMMLTNAHETVQLAIPLVPFYGRICYTDNQNEW